MTHEMITMEQLTKATDIARWIYDQTGETSSFDIKFNSYSERGLNFSIWSIMKACTGSGEKNGYFNYDTIEQLLENEQHIKKTIFDLILLKAQEKKAEQNGN